MLIARLIGVGRAGYRWLALIDINLPWALDHDGNSLRLFIILL